MATGTVAAPLQPLTSALTAESRTFVDLGAGQGAGGAPVRTMPPHHDAPPAIHYDGVECRAGGAGAWWLRVRRRWCVLRPTTVLVLVSRWMVSVMFRRWT